MKRMFFRLVALLAVVTVANARPALAGGSGHGGGSVSNGVRYQPSQGLTRGTPPSTNRDHRGSRDGEGGVNITTGTPKGSSLPPSTGHAGGGNDYSNPRDHRL
jgi:hypothetical protein